MNGAGPSASVPKASSSGYNENPATEMVNAERIGKGVEPQAQQAQNIYSDHNGAQEIVGGMTKIVASDFDVSTTPLSCLPFTECVRVYVSVYERKILRKILLNIINLCMMVIFTMEMACDPRH